MSLAKELPYEIGDFIVDIRYKHLLKYNGLKRQPHPEATFEFIKGEDRSYVKGTTIHYPLWKNILKYNI